MTRGWPGAAIPSHPHFDLRWLSVIALCTAMDLASIAVANAGSRQDNDASYVFFWHEVEGNAENDDRNQPLPSMTASHVSETSMRTIPTIIPTK